MVIFSQARVILSTREVGISGSMSFLGVDIYGTRSLGDGYFLRWVCPGDRVGTHPPPAIHGTWDMVEKRAVCFLLGCFLISYLTVYDHLIDQSYFSVITQSWQIRYFFIAS